MSLNDSKKSELDRKIAELMARQNELMNLYASLQAERKVKFESVKRKIIASA